MSAVLQSGAAAFLARYHGLRARLPGPPDVRESAAASFAAGGLPSHHDEDWKYTSLRSIAEVAFHEPMMALADGQGVPQDLPALDIARLVFTDGRLRDEFSVIPAGVDFAAFAARPIFGIQAQIARDPMVALNTMLAEDGIVLAVPKGYDAGAVALISLGSEVHGRKVAFHPRHVLRLAAGAQLTLLEIDAGQGTYLHNPVFDIVLEEGATLRHVRLQRESLAAFHLATLYVTIGAGARYENMTLHAGARTARSELHAEIIGTGGSMAMSAAQLLREAQHGDITAVVRHVAAEGVSRQVVKSVLDGHARGVFQGRIEVGRGAQRTDGQQHSQALLLSPDAEISTKPELEIYADDVKCSHGATVGELDADQLFYLQSRGVPEAQARAMLVRAFLAELVEDVQLPVAREMLEQVLERWWEMRA